MPKEMKEYKQMKEALKDNENTMVDPFNIYNSLRYLAGDVDPGFRSLTDKKHFFQKLDKLIKKLELMYQHLNVSLFLQQLKPRLKRSKSSDPAIRFLYLSITHYQIHRMEECKDNKSSIR